jgi:hypothetical protein
MSWRYVAFVTKAALLVAALLLAVPQVRAGDRDHAAKPTAPRPQPVPIPVVRAMPQSMAVSVVVTMPVQPSKEQLYVNLRGPDGQVRRFPVESRAAIQYRKVIVHAGETLTIRWAPAK